MGIFNPAGLQYNMAGNNEFCAVWYKWGAVVRRNEEGFIIINIYSEGRTTA